MLVAICSRLVFRSQRTVNQRLYSGIYSVPKVAPQTERWNQAIAEATELLDQKKTFPWIAATVMNELQLSDILMKLVASGHPIVHQSKLLAFDTRFNFQVRGLIALLLAKASGHTPSSEDYEEAVRNEGVTERQRKLADVIELYYSHFLTHNSVLNLNHDRAGEFSKSLQSINGLAVLGGDYLASSGLVMLASILNPTVLGLMSSTIIDFAQHIFSGEVDKHGNMIPEPDYPQAVWEERTFLEHACLLSRGCQGMMVLAGQDQIAQNRAAEFGKCTALAMKVSQDLQDFQQISMSAPGTPFPLSLAPVVLHLQDDSVLLRDLLREVQDDITNLDFQKLYQAVQNGNGLNRSVVLLNGYIQRAEENLNSLGSTSQSLNLLQLILKSLVYSEGK